MFGCADFSWRLTTIRSALVSLCVAGGVAADLDPSQVLGELVAKLSQSEGVFVQTFEGCQWITIQAHRGRVAHALGKTANVGIRYDTEWVAGDAGLVIQCYGARGEFEGARAWEDDHDVSLRSGERIVRLADEKIFPFEFRYGPRCDPALITWLMAYRLPTAGVTGSP